MKKTILWLTVLALLCALCGCHVTPAPTPAGEKTAFCRRFVSVSLEKAFARYFTKLSTNDTYTAYYEYQNATDGTQTAVLSQFDYANTAERTLYQTTFTPGNGAMPINVSYGGDTVWITLFTEGDLMYGGTTPDSSVLQAVNVTDGTIRREWNLNDAGLNYSHTLLATDANAAYLAFQCTDTPDWTYWLIRIDIETGELIKEDISDNITTFPNSSCSVTDG